MSSTLHICISKNKTASNGEKSIPYCEIRSRFAANKSNVRKRIPEIRYTGNRVINNARDRVLIHYLTAIRSV